MRIAINAQLLGRMNSGVERYIQCLLNSLDSSELTSSHKIDVYVPASTKVSGNWQRLTAKRIKGVSASRFLRIGWEQLLLPLVLRNGYDLLHAPGYVCPLLSGVPMVTTVHDVFALQRPALCARANAFHYRFMLPASLNKAARIIAPSNWVKSQIMQCSGLTSEKIQVVYEGIDPLFLLPPDPNLKQQLVKRYGLTGRVILFVGNIEPKKNIPLLLTVFDRLRDKLDDIQLVICGRIRWRSQHFRKEWQRLRYHQSVILTGWLDDEELHALYHLAEVFVFPSVVEGFGLPPLEAMACGTPVIASRTGALSEVLADAALLFDPTNDSELEDLLIKVLTDGELRQRLTGRGLVQSSRYSWQRAANETVQVYASALNQTFSNAS